MSWTNECTQSSWFRVKHQQEVREVFEQLGFIVHTCIDEKDNKEYMLIITSGEGVYLDEDTEVVLSIKPIKINAVERNFLGVLSDYTEKYI